MLYDIKGHLPPLVEELSRSFITGDIDKLEKTRTVIIKLLADDKDYINKVSIAKEMRDNNKEPIVKKVIELDREIKSLTEKLDKEEYDYWETFIGTTTRTIRDQPYISD